MLQALVLAAALWFLNIAGIAPAFTKHQAASQDQPVFGRAFPKLDSNAVGKWWEPQDGKEPPLLVPRDQTLGFAVYAHDRGVLKLTAQLHPLLRNESRKVQLDFQENGAWKQLAESDVIELGWSAPGPRATMVENLKQQDPDLLFFAGDQSYHHTEHTFGWLEFGAQFREVLKDRPVITIPDDHDVGQVNIWDENGKKAATAAGPSGGYFYPVSSGRMRRPFLVWSRALDPSGSRRARQSYDL